jgi:hypothetical protein
MRRKDAGGRLRAPEPGFPNLKWTNVQYTRQTSYTVVATCAKLCVRDRVGPGLVMAWQGECDRACASKLLLPSSSGILAPGRWALA